MKIERSERSPFPMWSAPSICVTATLTSSATGSHFTRGHVTFSGDLVPELDFLAQARAADGMAMIDIIGSAFAPQFTFSSQPPLRQDEIFSRILFARGAGTFSAFQALQLVQAAAQFFSGGGNGPLGSLENRSGLGATMAAQVGSSGGCLMP
jgi:translocation and assembly module TamB